MILNKTITRLYIWALSSGIKRRVIGRSKLHAHRSDHRDDSFHNRRDAIRPNDGAGSFVFRLLRS